MPTEPVQRTRRLVLMTLAAAAVAAPTWIDAAPHAVWNASASAPLGLFWSVSRRIQRGDFVLADPPPDGRRLAVERGYLRARVRLLKRVAALAGDQICSDGGTIRINGRLAATRLAADSEGRPLPVWTGCRTLESDEALLLMTDVAASFDGRYFGPVRMSAIAGPLVPVWTYAP